MNEARDPQPILISVTPEQKEALRVVSKTTKMHLSDVVKCLHKTTPPSGDLSSRRTEHIGIWDMQGQTARAVGRSLDRRMSRHLLPDGSYDTDAIARGASESPGDP